MELKTGNHIFTMSSDKVLYSRLINAKLKTIYIDIKSTISYQEVVAKMQTMLTP
jgi:hypothetical protein